MSFACLPGLAGKINSQNLEMGSVTAPPLLHSSCTVKEPPITENKLSTRKTVTVTVTVTVTDYLF